MLLKVKDRLLLLNTLPGESDYITLKVIREVQDNLSFSDDELTRLKVTKTEDMYTWDEEIDEFVDVEIGESARGLIKQELRKLNEQGQLKMEFLPLYEHFWEGEEWPPKVETSEEPSGDSDEPIPLRTTQEVAGSRPAAEGSSE